MALRRWRRGRGITVAFCVLFAGASPAAARILRATSILPPGESGFVSVAGVNNGTGSPHLYDQQQPFITFQRKNAMFDQRGTAEVPRAGVRIIRDSYGVPDIRGHTTADLWWGAGYATAEDRLFELELFRRATTGHLAEVLGASYLPMDIEIRRDFYTPDELGEMYATLSPSMQARYTAYTNGINAWVAQVQRDPSDLPAEFPALGITPSDFTPEDMIAIGVYLARTTPNTDGADLQNMQAIQEAGPQKFNRILPLRIKGQVSTIPKADGLFPSVPGRTALQERRALARSYAYVRDLPVPAANNLGDEVVGGVMPPLPTQDYSQAADDGASVINPLSPIHRGGSYMVAVTDPHSHQALLFNGPELGFSAPEELYEMELHGPGLEVRGITAPGAPVIAIGHNAHVAFGLTSGLSQTNALYVEHLVPGHPDEYHYRGHVVPMSCRNETFDYRPPPTSLLAASTFLASPPEAGSVTVRLCRTINGPVQERVGGIVYARRYATWDREIATLTGLAAVDRAKNIAQVNHAAGELTWNENLMAADDHGNIGYWHPGLLPIRPPGWDERLPYPGSGVAEWRGFLTVDQRPHVVDPKQHWLANWNTLPSQGWTTGNDPASERVGGPWFRGAYLNMLARHVAQRPTFEQMEQLVHHAGTIAQQRPLATSKLRAALHGAGPRETKVLRTILSWNGSYTQTNAHGTVKPGVAAWQELKDQLQARALAPLGPGGELIGGGEPNEEHLFDADLGQAYALRTLGTAGWRLAAEATFRILSSRFHSTNPATWRAPRAMYQQSVLGAEQPPPMPFFDRGTFEQIVQLGPKR